MQDWLKQSQVSCSFFFVDTFSNYLGSWATTCKWQMWSWTSHGWKKRPRLDHCATKSLRQEQWKPFFDLKQTDVQASEDSRQLWRFWEIACVEFVPAGSLPKNFGCDFELSKKKEHSRLSDDSCSVLCHVRCLESNVFPWAGKSSCEDSSTWSWPFLHEWRPWICNSEKRRSAWKSFIRHFIQSLKKKWKTPGNYATVKWVQPPGTKNSFNIVSSTPQAGIAFCNLKW